MLVRPDTLHEHNFEYDDRGGGNAIDAVCLNETTCPLPKKGSMPVITLTIMAPLHTAYGDGKDPAASLHNLNDFNEETGLKVSADAVCYYRATKNGTTYTEFGEPLTATPTDVGDYVAKITVGPEGNSATASVGYSIARGTPAYATPSDLKGSFADKLSAVSLPTATDGSWNWQNTDETVGLGGEFEAVFTPKDSTHYAPVTVKVPVALADPTTSVTVTLRWIPATPSDVTQVSAQLKDKEGHQIALTLKPDSGWSMTVLNLPKYNENGRIQYTLETQNVTSAARGEFRPTVTVNVGKDDTAIAVSYSNGYTVKFNANGGNSATVPQDMRKLHGEALTLPTEKPTHASTRTVNTISFDANGGQCETRSLSSNMYYTYSFREWNTKANGTGAKYAPGGSYNEDAEATLYARWSLGISITPITLPTPTREGYTFKGWATTKGAVSGVTGTYTPSYSHTLYAVWQINKYTISFDTAGGSSVAPITQDYGTAIRRPADPTREGHSFAGWSETIPWTMPAKDMEVTAKWTVNQYSVRYDANGGTGTMTDVQGPYDYGTEVTALENGFTAPANRSFGGWNTEADGTGTPVAAGDPFTLTGDTTLYAQWNKRKPACFTSLNLADGFDLRFYVSGMDDYEGLTISWTGKDGQLKDSRPVNSVDPVTSGSITAYGFVLESFTAREMTQSAHVTITDADGEILTEVDCSVKSYCDQALKTGSATLKALSQAVLDYGTYTQRYFKYNMDKLPNPEADGADLPAVPAAFDYTVQGSSKGVKGTNITLALSDRTALNFYFTLESESYTAASYTVTVKNAAGAAVQPNINVVNTHGVRALQVMITGISAKDLGKMWDVTLRSVEDGSEIVFHGSPRSYAYRSQDDAELGNTVKGLYNYYLKADEFFRSR